MNLHWRNLLPYLIPLSLVLGPTGPRGVALAKERMPPRIDCDITVPSTAEEVWAAWTTVEGLESFLARTARVGQGKGGEYVIHLGPQEVLYSRAPRILLLDAPRTLSFEWIIPLPQAAASDPMTVVTIHIEPLSTNRCRVRLKHTGWAISDQKTEEFAYSKRSWKIVLRNLRSALTVRGEGTFTSTDSGGG